MDGRCEPPDYSGKDLHIRLRNHVGTSQLKSSMCDLHDSCNLENEDELLLVY